MNIFRCSRSAQPKLNNHAALQDALVAQYMEDTGNETIKDNELPQPDQAHRAVLSLISQARFKCFAKVCGSRVLRYQVTFILSRESDSASCEVTGIGPNQTRSESFTSP